MIVRAALLWSVAGVLAAVVLPWYSLEEGLGSGVWMGGLWSSEDYASGLAAILVQGKGWLVPTLAALLACLIVALLPLSNRRRGDLLVVTAGAGVALFAAQAFAVGLRGWNAGWLVAAFGDLEGRQIGIGAGATVVLIALLSLLSIGLALRGAFGGDAFVAGAMTAVTTSILLFTAWPIIHILAQAFQDSDGALQPLLMPQRLANRRSGACAASPGAAIAAWHGTHCSSHCVVGRVRPCWGSPSR